MWRTIVQVSNHRVSVLSSSSSNTMSLEVPLVSFNHWFYFVCPTCQMECCRNQPMNTYSDITHRYRMIEYECRLFLFPSPHYTRYNCHILQPMWHTGVESSGTSTEFFFFFEYDVIGGTISNFQSLILFYLSQMLDGGLLNPTNEHTFWYNIQVSNDRVRLSTISASSSTFHTMSMSSTIPRFVTTLNVHFEWHLTNTLSDMKHEHTGIKWCSTSIEFSFLFFF